MKIKKMSRFLSVMMLASVFFFGFETTSKAANTNLQTPEQTLNTYFSAEKSGDSEQMANLAKDTRFVDTKAQKAEYKKSHETYQLLDYRFTDKQKIAEDHYVFTVVPNYSGMDSLPGIPYSVVKEQGRWKVLIEPIDVNLVQGSRDFGKVTRNTTKMVQNGELTISQHLTSPEATAVLYYSFSNLGPNQSMESSNEFFMSRADGQVTLNGWQDVAGTGFAYAKYEIIKRVNNIVTIQATTTVWGDTLKSDPWFSYYFQGVASGNSYKLRVSSLKDPANPYYMNGAGNLYL